MPTGFTRRSVLGALGLATVPYAASRGTAAQSDESGPYLNRFATSASGAEITGLYLTQDGDFFFNVQHPSEDNLYRGYSQGSVGALQGFDMQELPEDFGSVPVPDNEYAAGNVITAFGTHAPLAHGGDTTDDGEPLGIPTTPDGEVLTDGHDPDFNGFVPDGEGEGYLFSNWESRPGAVSRIHVRKNSSGLWRVGETMNVDFSAVEGTWVNCFGTVSPWNTPLTAEENYAHTSTGDWNNPDYDYVGSTETLADYLGAEGDYEETYPNPYRYGYIVEIEAPTSDSPTPNKRWALGRSAHENAVVMPDERTVYTSSDGTGKHFYKFVADEAGDLSSGTLYAASASQNGDAGANPASVGFDLEWIELASASQDDIESWIADYDDITQADYDGGNSYITDAEVEEWAAGNADDDRVAFLESRKAGSALGATTEFRKMEGVNIRNGAEPGDYLYVAMSAVTETMADEEGEIRLDGNEYGAVYRMEIESDYNVSRMVPVVTGGENANICGGCPYDANPNTGDSVCQDCSFNPDNQDEDGMLPAMTDTTVDTENTIANPDNIVVMDDGRVIIGEDTGFHDNNMIWVYNPGEA